MLSYNNNQRKKKITIVNQFIKPKIRSLKCNKPIIPEGRKWEGSNWETEALTYICCYIK